MKIRLITPLALLVSAWLPGIAKQPDQRRPLEIAGADASIREAHVTGPRYSAPEVFRGGEDFHNPRIERLRQQYDFLKVIQDEPNDFSKILKLRHWVHRQWPIDDEQSFSGDAFAILQHAHDTGEGFHCAHAMTVQYAVLTASGYVARNLGIDRSHAKFGRSFHHGINEVWSNDHAKWVALDAKYDIHFERHGVPLSALELHESLRNDDGQDVQMVKGVERRPVPRPEPHEYGGRIDSYWWVAWHVRSDSFTQPHFSGVSSMVIWDNEAFRNDTWYRGGGDSLAKHWAYAAGAFIPIAQRQRIEWTPGVVSLGRTIQVEPGRLRVEPRSSTPNLELYRYQIDDAPWQPLEAGESIDWPLVHGVNTLRLRTQNRFGVQGPIAAVEVVADLAEPSS